MKEIDVLGVTIRDYPLKELIKNATDFLTTPGVKTMSWLSANVLLNVSENTEEQLPWVDALDLTVCDQAGLLKSGRAASQLHIDGKSEDFMENYFRYLGNNGASIALVGDNTENIEHLAKKLRGYSSKLNIISRHAYENADFMDDLFNQLNMEFPKVVITCLPWTLQGPLVEMAKEVSNSAFWISMLPEMFSENNTTMVKKNEAFFDRFLFGRRVASYQKKDK